VAQAYKGTFSSPPTSGPKTAAGKSVWVISCGQVATSCSSFANGAMAAGKAAGWSMHLYDARLNPANYTVGIDEAIAAHANGIVTVAADCDLARTALSQAKSAGVKTVGIVSFDCNDPLQRTGPPLYSTFPEFHGQPQYGGAFEEFAKIRAAWLIQQTNGKAKVVATNEPGFLISAHQNAGFNAEMKTCSTCSVLNTVTITPTDLTGGTEQSKFQSAVLKYHPNAIFIENDSFFQQFADAALKSVGYSHIAIAGGECVDATVTAAIRAGGPEQACAAYSPEWIAWGAMDELNRQFVHPGSKPVDEGLGFQLVDKSHNLPSSGAYQVPVDFKSAYLKVWTGK
jgi:ribose transport system substrate-binding protein